MLLVNCTNDDRNLVIIQIYCPGFPGVFTEAPEG